MFGTLRYEASNRDGEFLEQGMSLSGLPTNRLLHMACDNCRVKKIRCSGRRTGCYRCTTLGLPCTYSGPSPRKRARKKSPPCYESNLGGQDDGVPRGGEFTGDPNAEDPSRAGTASHSPSRPSSALLEEKDTAAPSQLDQLDGGDVGQEDGQFFLNSFDWHLSSHDGQHGSPRVSSIIHPPSDPSKRSLSTPGNEPSISHPRISPFQDDTMLHDALSMYPPTLATDRLPLDPIASHPTPPPSVKSRQSHSHSNSQSLSSSSTQHPQPCSCTCLSTAVFLLDELETSGDADPHAQKKQLDSHLSSYREILSLCENMLQCRTCCQRPENMTVLNLVLERQANLSSSMVDAYLALTSRDCAGNNSHTIAQTQPQSQSQPSNSTSAAPALPERPEMLLGEYNIAESEWESVVLVLIFKQLSAFDRLLSQMKRVPSLAQRDSQMARLRSSELRNRCIARQLWPALPESIPLSDLGVHFMLGSR
ncbi:hypothetical protein BDW62DRAFT_186153 [Aspergillus aurantiobrunneus]